MIFTFLVAAYLTLGWNPNAAATEPSNAAAAEQTAASLSEMSKAYKRQLDSEQKSNLAAECNPNDERRDSELCAQWKAADAAAQSAW